MQVSFLHSENPTGNHVSLWISRESTSWLQIFILTKFNPSALFQTQYNTWQRILFPANLTALRLIIVCRWRINGQLKCLFSTLLAEPLPTGDLHNVLIDLYVPFWVSCAATCTQLSRLTNVLNKWMILQLQPIMLWTLPRTFGQPSSAFAMPKSNRKMKKKHFGVRQGKYLGRTISSDGVSPQTHKIQNFFKKNEIPRNKKGFQLYLGFVIYHRNHFPKTVEKLNLFHKLLETEVPINTGIETNFWFSKQNTEWCLRTSIDTTHSWEAAPPHDGCKPQKRWQYPHDWRPYRSESSMKAENVGTCSIQIKKFLPGPTQNVNLLQRSFGSLQSISRICTPLVGSNKTDKCSDG